jgi:hypothetical protein
LEDYSLVGYNVNHSAMVSRFALTFSAFLLTIYVGTLEFGTILKQSHYNKIRS